MPKCKQLIKIKTKTKKNKKKKLSEQVYIFIEQVYIFILHTCDHLHSNMYDSKKTSMTSSKKNEKKSLIRRDTKISHI